MDQEVRMRLFQYYFSNSLHNELECAQDWNTNGLLKNTFSFNFSIHRIDGLKIQYSTIAEEHKYFLKMSK